MTRTQRTESKQAHRLGFGVRGLGSGLATANPAEPAAASYLDPMGIQVTRTSSFCW
jgi:hypothetical protein